MGAWLWVAGCGHVEVAVEIPVEPPVSWQLPTGRTPHKVAAPVGFVVALQRRLLCVRAPDDCAAEHVGREALKRAAMGRRLPQHRRKREDLRLVVVWL